MTLAEDHDALKELSTAAADPALGGSVLPRTAVEDEVSRRRVVGKRLT